MTINTDIWGGVLHTLRLVLLYIERIHAMFPYAFDLFAALGLMVFVIGALDFIAQVRADSEKR